MVKPLSQPRSYEGYGSGAATPDSAQAKPRVPKGRTQNINAPQQSTRRGWKPSVTRTRPDLPTNPPPREQRVAKPAAAPAPKPPTRGGGSVRAAATAAKSAAAGIGGNSKLQRAAKIAVGVNPMQKLGPEATKMQKLKFGMTGGRGKLFVALNGVNAVAVLGANMFNQDELKQQWYADPSLQAQYASPDDYMNSLNGQAVTAAVGSALDTAVFVGAEMALSSILALALPAGPAGWIAAGIVFLALPGILDSVTNQPDPMTGSTEPMIIGLGNQTAEATGIEAFRGIGAVAQARLGYHTSMLGANLGTGLYQNSPLEDIARALGWKEENIRTPEEKAALRESMGPSAFMVETVDEEGNIVYERMYKYKTFGERTDEVNAILAQGFFLTPTEVVSEVAINGRRQSVRRFKFDYRAFTDWFEATMWVAGKGNGMEPAMGQARALPPLNPEIVKVLTKETPLTQAERQVVFRDTYENIDYFGSPTR